MKLIANAYLAIAFGSPFADAIVFESGQRRVVVGAQSVGSLEHKHAAHLCRHGVLFGTLPRNIPAAHGSGGGECANQARLDALVRDIAIIGEGARRFFKHLAIDFIRRQPALLIETCVGK